MVKILAGMILVSLYGCETVKGAGRDIANTASNIREVLRLGKDIKDISN